MTVTNGAEYRESRANGDTMDGMPIAAHAKPAPKRDHLWVLAVIAAFALYDVWESWTQVGNKSGFAHGTGWTLTVIVEAYACYALYAWFHAPGPRSRRFAMWSAAGVLGLSLIGQGSSSLAAHRLPPVWLAVFVKDLPVVVLALIAVLVHLRMKDRDDAAEADERTGVQAEMDALRGALAGAQEAGEATVAELGTARADLEKALAKIEVLTRKLAAGSGPKRARKSPPKKAPASTPETPASSPPEVQVPEDVDTQAAALEILAQEPNISGSALGRRLGKSERYGCMLKNQLTGSVAGPDGGSAGQS